MNTNNSGLGFMGLLTIMFVGLKLTSYIDWSWWWVLSPLWMPLTLVLGVAIIVGLIAIIIDYFNKTKLKGKK